MHHKFLWSSGFLHTNYTCSENQSLDETLYACKLGIKFNDIITSIWSAAGNFTNQYQSVLHNKSRYSLLVNTYVLECLLPTDKWLKVASCQDDTWEDQAVSCKEHMVDIFTFIFNQIGPWLLKSKSDNVKT